MPIGNLEVWNSKVTGSRIDLDVPGACRYASRAERRVPLCFHNLGGVVDR
jgi:hypothetical protein